MAVEALLVPPQSPLWQEVFATASLEEAQTVLRQRLPEYIPVDWLAILIADGSRSEWRTCDGRPLGDPWPWLCVLAESEAGWAHRGGDAMQEAVFFLARHRAGRVGFAIRTPARIDNEKLGGWRALARLLGQHCRALLEQRAMRSDIERLAHAERLQRALYEISDLSNSGAPMAQMLAGMHQVVGRLMYAENFYIVRYDPFRESIRFLYFSDVQDESEPDPDTDYSAVDIPNSLTMALIRHGQPVLGPSEVLRKQLGVARDETQGPDSEDWLGVPLMEDGQVRGAVVVQSYDPSVRYDLQDQALLVYVAQHIQIALNRREAQQALELRVEERTQALREEVAERQRGEKLQSALFRIASLAGEDLPIERFYAELHHIVGELLEARNFYIALYEPQAQRIDFPYSVDEREIERHSRPLGNGLTEYVLRTKRPLLADRRLLDRLASEGELAPQGVLSYSWLGVPLLIGDESVGVLTVQSYSPEHRYEERDQTLLSFVSIHIAAALEKRRASLALQSAYAEMEQRVEERTRELAEANEALRAQMNVRERMEVKLKHEAMHDTLTGLPNRSHLLQRLGLALRRYHENEVRTFAVLFLDLDRFKVVNDSVGHLIGDELLKEAGKRISNCVREPDLVARLGGDEFAILLEHMQSPDDAVAVAERVLRAFHDPIRVYGKELYTSTSIGIAYANPQYQRPEELLRDADNAMYRAKDSGRHRYALFDQQLREEALTRMEMEGELRRAMQRDEFLPYYQPIQRLGDGGIVGFEALMRWQHPQDGIRTPAQFLHVAEDSGSLEALDWQLYERVCADLPTLAARGLYVSLNVAPRHWRNEAFAERMLDLLRRQRVVPGSVRLELTEGALLDPTELVYSNLRQLREAGMGILLDDFGTGYSSLSYLHRYPLSGLKIDRGFIADLRADTRSGSAAIVRAIRLMSDSLGLEVIAEGIETEAQRSLLLLLGLQHGQGFLFAPGEPLDLALQRIGADGAARH
jgi:diguanylate cyclase (GGDEF)-like protein